MHAHRLNDRGVLFQSIKVIVEYSPPNDVKSELREAGLDVYRLSRLCSVRKLGV